MRVIRLRIILSLALKYKPDLIGVRLDEYGWADVNKLIDAIKNKGIPADYDKLKFIVVSDSKCRYIFNEDNTKIKAVKGHGRGVDIGVEVSTPPTVLYHGTSVKSKGTIQDEGIKPRGGLYVHMSKDEWVAREVGSKRGNPYVFKIDSKKMHEDGIEFYISKNGVWLVSYVDPRYLKE